MTSVLSDLHIHTALSPCASRDMTPLNIVRTCRQRGLDMIAVCDHNSSANAAAVAEAARREGGGLKVIPGIEVTTREEVHVLGMFPSLQEAMAVGERVLESLPEAEGRRPDHSTSGIPCQQWLFDAEDRRIGSERRFLAAASGYSLGEAVSLIRRHGGLAVAAHIDRRAFSVLGQLGFFPETPRFFAAEISAAAAARCRKEPALIEEFRRHGLPLISSSDSHFPEQIACSCTALVVAELCFAELVLAIRAVGSRRCQIA
jgi:predicted metal-dependent phosphoesterase TrpH